MSGTVRHCDEAPERRAGNDATAAREVLAARDGCELFTLRTLRTVHGHGIARETGAADELLFAVSGRGVLIAADGEHELEPETGALVGAGESYELVNGAPRTCLSCRCRCTTRCPPGRRRGRDALAPGRRGGAGGHGRRASSGSSSIPTTAARRRRSSSATSRSAPRPRTITSTKR